MPYAPTPEPTRSCRHRSNQPHNAHNFETATVYYRWHPLFRQTLRVHKRMKDRHGEHIFCELPDGTICSLPSWMFRPESMHFSLGSPLISVEALAALRELIEALRTPASCDMASLSQSPKEGVDEATSDANKHAVQPPAARRTRGSTSSQQTERTRARTDGVAAKRRSRVRRPSGTRRRK